MVRIVWEFAWADLALVVLDESEVILETGGNVQKIQKGHFFTTKKLKRGTPYLTSPYVHCLFIIVLIEQIFERNKSSRAVSGSQTQF